MAKPADFYVGVLDVFSILLPGAVVSWTAWVWLGGETALHDLVPRDDTASWVAFVLVGVTVIAAMFLPRKREESHLLDDDQTDAALVIAH